VDINAALGASNDAAFYGPPVGMPDGRLELEGSSWAPGGSLGVLYRASSSTRLGLAWTSSAQHSVDMDLHGRNLHPVLAGMLPGPGQVALDVTLPQQLTLSATTQLSPATLLGISTGWQDWSVVGQSKLRASGQAASMFPDGLRDTWNLSVGIRHEMSAAWALTAGVAYDGDPSVHGDMPAYFPVAEQLRIAGGVERRLSEDCTLRIALSVINQGDVRVEQGAHPIPLPGIGPLSGSFTNSRVYVLAAAADFAL
jgi:long-chain fatty acid transport protein